MLSSSKVGRTLLIVVLVVAVGAGAFAMYRARSGAAVPLGARVQEALAAGRVTEAVELARRAASAGAEVRGEVSGLMLQWAIARDTPAATASEAANVGEAYIAALGLDSSNKAIYARIADFLGRHRIASVASRANGYAQTAAVGDDAEFVALVSSIGRLSDLCGAIEAAERGPNDVEAQVEAAKLCDQAGLPEDAVRYAGKARALAPDRLDVLDLLASLGLIEPVGTTQFASVTLPFHGWFLAEGNARNGRVLVTGNDDEGKYLGCVVTVPGGRVLGTFEGFNYKSVVLSPTGRYVLYADDADLGEPCEVYILDLQTSQTRTLATVTGTVPGAAWSPDETHIALATFDGLLLLNADGSGEPRVLQPAVAQGGMTDWSAQAYPRWIGGAGSTRIASQHLGWEYLGKVLVHDLAAGSTATALSMSGTAHEIGLVTWSPDGTKMAYGRRGADNEWAWSVVIAQTGAASADSPAILSGPVDAEPLGWSLDGTRLIVRVGHGAWLLETATGTLSLFPPEVEYHVIWGEDGELYYLADSGKRLVGIRLK